MAKIRLKPSDEKICDLILRYGSPVLTSEAFKRTSEETHHLRSSLTDHTLNVCIMSLRLSELLNKMHIETDPKDLIQASLCHDLGMLDRTEKYSGRTAAWKGHAEESDSIARDLLPDISDNAENIILSHMWPVSSQRPGSKEAVIVTAADKWASAADWVTILTGRKYRKALKAGLYSKSRDLNDSKVPTSEGL